PPAPSPQPNGRSRRCSNERATRSGPPPPGSPHWPTSPHTHQPKTSRSRRKPNQRVNNRQALNVQLAGTVGVRYGATHGQIPSQVTAYDGTDRCTSQTDSAGSIPVTRSNQYLPSSSSLSALITRASQ